MSHVVIIGAGLAGHTVARELLALKSNVAITIVTADDGHQYPKPQLSSGLRLGKQPDDLIVARAESLASRGIALIPRARVTSIRPRMKQIDLHDGRTLAYDHLVLALGASPSVPRMEGPVEAIHTVNHLDDYRHFRQHLVEGRPVLIIGGGLIGIEFAADLASIGQAATVVDPGPFPVSRLLPAGAADLLTRALEPHGVSFLGRRNVVSLAGAPGAFEATLSDGTIVQAGTVLSAVGLRPQVELARSAGLPVRHGVLVDERMRAAPDVYAVGDCAELPGGRYLPFIRPISDMAKYVARAIAGEAEGPLALPNYAITIKVPQWPVASTSPLPEEEGVWEEALAAEGSLSKLVNQRSEVVRVVATGNRASEVQQWLQRMPASATPA